MSFIPVTHCLQSTHPQFAPASGCINAMQRSVFHG